MFMKREFCDHIYAENSPLSTHLLFSILDRWGFSRHFHYVPEILAAFFWTVPALFNHFMPYFYVIHLTILLLDRAKRDDDRCSTKYGKYWKMYCNRVPYRVVPGIY
uniref:7-dehydrocholesterol reductase n=1 Tax=Aegilops tauschii subsp. strangulata TaxID=200361 RepID=A0A453GMV0_AEGTS